MSHCGLPAPVEPKFSPCGIYGINIGKRANVVIFHRFALHAGIEFKENLRVRYRKYGGIENMVFQDNKKQNPLSTEET